MSLSATEPETGSASASRRLGAFEFPRGVARAVVTNGRVRNFDAGVRIHTASTLRASMIFDDHQQHALSA